MIPFSETHLIFFAATGLFLALSMLLVSKLPHRAQTVIFVLGALMCAGSIFFRYGMACTLDGNLRLKMLCLQMMRVSGFNMILVPLMLVPKLEQARQYSMFFSLFVTGAMLVKLPFSWPELGGWNVEMLSTWSGCIFAVAVPLWMLAARRLKPQKKYVLPTMVCVAVYFSGVYIFSELLLGKGLITLAEQTSFVYNTHGIVVFDILWRIIPQPFFYLLPLAPFLYGFFLVLAKAFDGYRVLSFNGIPLEAEEPAVCVEQPAQTSSVRYAAEYTAVYEGEEETEPDTLPVGEPLSAAALRPASGVILRPTYAPCSDSDEEVSMVEQAGMAEKLQ